MRVRATRFGVDARGAGRQPGEEFDHTGALGSWMELVETPAAAEAAPSEAPAAPEPETEAVADAPPQEAKRNLRNRRPAKES